MSNTYAFIHKNVLSEEAIVTFRKNYSDGEIKFASIDNISELVMSHFEGRSRRFISPKEYFPNDFEQFFKITHKSLEITHVAQQKRTYHTGDTEHLTYLIDLDTNKHLIGHGEIRFSLTNISPYFLHKPFVGYNLTHEKFQKKGYGIKRLHVMNALSHLFYSLPLNSDTVICDMVEENLWNKLVKDGFAKKYIEGNHQRYVFLNMHE